MTVQMDRAVATSRDGTPIAYVRVGSGPPLIVVHGAWASGDAYLALAELLSDHVTCHVMDRRGRGDSGDGARYDLECELADIEAVLDAAGPDASLFGHSGGALYALEVARRISINRLVLYEPPFRHQQGPHVRAFLDRFRGEVEAGRDEAATTMFFREMVGMDEDSLNAFQSTPAWRQRVPRAWTVAREMAAMLDAGLTVERYRDVSVPTLLLEGTETREEDLAAARRLHELLPNTRIAKLDGQGHTAHLFAPDLIANEVSRFLAARQA